MGTTDVVCKVDNEEDGTYYEWPIEKLHDRVMMLRNILEDFHETGEKPQLARNEDPLWDPANPMLVGQAFLSLSALGCGIECATADASLLSVGGGGKTGEIDIGYHPCTPDGDTDEDNLPDHLLVEKPEELLGVKEYDFLVKVNGAKGLPADLCKNPYVTYIFKFDKGTTHRVPEVKGSSRDPRFNYCFQHQIDEVTEDVV